MNKTEKEIKKPIAKGTIYKVMLYVTFIVASLFFLKNVIAGSVTAIMTIGICLGLFACCVIAMHFLHAKDELKQFVVSISLLFLVFLISLNSGESFSDDFLLYLAVIGLTGMYLRPKYTIIQGVIADVLLIIQCFLHPEKAGSLSQYLLCLAMFILANLMFYMAINRGRAFIEISQSRAKEAERLLDSIKEAGGELQKNCESSSLLLTNLQDANERLEKNTGDLRTGSNGITQGAKDVAYTCEDVHDRIQITEKQIGALNDEVKTFEDALAVNRGNMDAMNRQIQSVHDAVQQVTTVFRLLEKQMHEISAVTEQLNSISSSTTMLALNASIEAARAGQSGAGFAVVASKVQELAVDSNKCSEQVASVVSSMQIQIQKTTNELSDSEQAIRNTFDTLSGLQSGFDQLTKQFDSLYQNIEAQNNNVSQVDSIFGELKGKITQMSTHSEENQGAVDAITQAMELYKDNMQLVIDDTKHIHELSTSMLNMS